MKKKPLFVAVALVLLVASCADYGFHRTGLSDEEMLTERARLFWEAKKVRDWDTLEEFIAPGMRVGWRPYFESIKKKPPTAEQISYNIRAVKVEGEKATVLTDVAIKFIHPLLEALPVQEKTVKNKI